MKHFAAVFIMTICSVVGYSQQMQNVTIEVKDVPKPVVMDTSVTNWDNSQPGYNRLSKAGKDFLYWTNYSRVNPRRFWDSVVAPILVVYPNLKSSYSESLKSDLYSSQPLEKFKLNPILIGTAQAHANDIGLKKAKPGHTSTDGRTFSDRLKAAGIKTCAGENISVGNVDPILSLVLLYIDYGIPTLGHRKSLLNPTYIETGIGVAPYGDTDNLFIVEDFSCGQ